jgi:hypothetical protein
MHEIEIVDVGFMNVPKEAASLRRHEEDAIRVCPVVNLELNGQRHSTKDHSLGQAVKAGH